MASKATGHWPVVEFDMAPRKAYGLPGDFTLEAARNALQEALEETRLILNRVLGRDYVLDIRGHVQSDFVCEHCNSRWTESSSTYNGGCCDADEQANPTAEQVSA